MARPPPLFTPRQGDRAIGRWTVDKSFMTKCFRLGRGDQYVVNGLNPRCFNILKDNITQFGIGVYGNPGTVIHVSKINPERPGTIIGQGEIHYTVERRNADYGELVLTAERDYPFLSDVKYVINAFVRDPFKNVSNTPKEVSVGVSKLAKSKLNVGPEGTAALSGKLTEFLGTPKAPGGIFGATPRPAPPPAEEEGPFGGPMGGRKHRRNTRKHRSRRHKKTRKH